MVLAGVLCAIPYQLFGDLIGGFWQDTGLSFWMTGLFLGAYGAGTVVVVGKAGVALFGEVRITKEGDEGEVFTGIGVVGRRRRVRWSDYNDCRERAVAAGAGPNAGMVRSVYLEGREGSYRFGEELGEGQRAFVIGFLREQGIGDGRGEGVERGG